MMKVITGNEFHTESGRAIVYQEQSEILRVGDSIKYNNEILTVKSIMPPSKPNGKWSILV